MLHCNLTRTPRSIIREETATVWARAGQSGPISALPDTETAVEVLADIQNFSG